MTRPSAPVPDRRSSRYAINAPRGERDPQRRRRGSTRSRRYVQPWPDRHGAAVGLQRSDSPFDSLSRRRYGSGRMRGIPAWREHRSGLLSLSFVFDIRPGRSGSAPTARRHTSLGRSPRKRPQTTRGPKARPIAICRSGASRGISGPHVYRSLRPFPAQWV